MFKSIEARDGGIEVTYNGREINWICDVGEVRVMVYEAGDGCCYEPNLIIGPKHSKRFWMSPPKEGAQYVIHLEKNRFGNDTPVRVLVSTVSDMGQTPEVVSTRELSLNPGENIALGGSSDTPESAESISEVSPMTLPTKGRFLIAVYQKSRFKGLFEIMQETHGDKWRNWMKDGFRALTDDGLTLEHVTTIQWRDDVALKVEWPETESE